MPEQGPTTTVRDAIDEAAQLLGVEPILLPDGGVILYVPADPTRRRVHMGRTSIKAPEMSAAQFGEWLRQENLDPAGAAAKLSALTGVTYRTEQVYQFRKGSRPVPARVRAVLGNEIPDTITTLHPLLLL